MNEAEAYARHKNLKLAANELGVRWQQLYARLRKLGIPVTEKS
jgi:transcriptional regulator with PAS, ATPase and Fis domain